MKKLLLILFFFPHIVFTQSNIEEINELNQETLIYPKEVHFKNLRQLTFEGENASSWCKR